MKKTLITRIVFVVGIVFLLILQYIWTYNTYKNVSKTLLENSSTSFDKAINIEIINRPRKFKLSVQIKNVNLENVPSQNKYNINSNSELNYVLNDIFNDEGSPMNLYVVDSLYCDLINKEFGFVPKHSIGKVGKDRVVELTKIKDIVAISTDKNTYLIEHKVGANEWIYLKLIKTHVSVIHKARVLFLSSILIVLIICIVIVIQFRNMQHDRKFVKFLVDYTRMLAHDLRTPVTGVRMLVSKVGRDRSLPEESRQKMLNQSVELTDKVLMNLDVLLYLAKSEHATIPVNKIPVNLSLFIESIVGVYKARDYAPKQVAFDCNIPDNVTIMLDKVLMENVLVNLLDNAIKYSGIETRIQMTVEKNAKELKLRIQDNGYGISPENQKHIFEIFERGAATENPSLPGFGLGLHFVQKAIQAHGGKVVLESEPGKGTVFTIILPVE